MKITLRIDGKDKTFSTDFIPGRIFRQAIEISVKVDFRNLKPETLDTLVDFVVDAYNKQFTRDEFYDGIDARNFVTTILDTVNQITGSATDAIGADPNDPN